MGFGLIGIGRNQADQAIQGFGEVSGLENARNESEKTMKAQQEQASTQMKGTMAGTGAMVGAMAGMGSAAMGAQLGMAAGPVGALAGAAAGYILGSLF
jgi:hypothetical protein